MSDLKQISELAESLIRLEREVAQAEVALKMKTEELRQVRENDLPEAMEAVGLTELRLSDGRRVRIEEQIHAAIPKASEAQAYAWLREHGFDSIIKNEVTLKFGKGEDESAHEALNLLLERGYNPSDKVSVHHSTLKAFVTEMLRSGEELPAELFGIHRRMVAKAS